MGLNRCHSTASCNFLCYGCLVYFMSQGRTRCDGDELHVLDLFSGAGGFSRGFQDAGFSVVAAVEVWEPAALTYARNHPGITMINDDIQDPNVKDKIDAINVDKRIHVVIGGPPCQGYSNAGNRDPLDPRGRLYLDFYEVVKRVQPLAFVMENVKGLLSMKVLPPSLDGEELEKVKDSLERLQRYKDLKRYGAQRELEADEREEFRRLEFMKSNLVRSVQNHLVPLLPIILDLAENAGYDVQWKVLNAKNHGSPQSRERVFIVGTKHGLDLAYRYPEPLASVIPVKDVLADLEDAPEGHLPNHDFTKHKPTFEKRLSRVKPGETVYKKYSDAWYRLVASEPSRTVKENHGGVFVHYDQDRVLTPRELARLQDFPDSFVFEGPKSQVLKQIGNAVPVNLARSVAAELLGTLRTLKHL